MTLVHPTGRVRNAAFFALSLLALALLVLVSISIGAGDFSWSELRHGRASEAWSLVAISRLPRTLALLLAGVSLAVAGFLMQMIVQNRYVEPTTAGTSESAMLGILFVMLVMPDIPVIGRMLIASGFALAGTLLFLLILQRVPLRSPFLAPLIGLVLGGVVHAVATYFAYRHDMMQSLHAWMTGDFSGVLRGRYEMLWIGCVLAAVTYLVADRFTILGMGKGFSTNLGINHRGLMLFGLVIIALIATVIGVTAGTIPFLGLIVPNVVSLVLGDNMRRALPWIALMGGGLVLLCDIIGRLVRYPYEIPIGVIMGVVGSMLFLLLILRGREVPS